ncbi:type IV secretion system DNA-binding domain-containing protein [Kitasatospora azatica]|uniref:type IV secretion system DNA-binding domain-containing protein n=1 Tax=Kitasatospora azatica TaxID=58347 RepID=UPI000AA8D9F9|nr:type IV secretion system DNA-binding domain-containing protein [Kitasatospora azatica]
MTDPVPGGPLGRLLTDPHSWWQATTDAVISVGTTDWPILIPAAAGSTAAYWTTRCALHRRRQQRLTIGGIAVTILSPPTAHPAAAAALWSHLVGLLRPWYRRLLTGQPHLAFEYHFTPAGLTVRLWAPASVPQALLRRAVEAAWPGTHTKTERLPVPLSKEDLFTTGGTLRLARPEILPLKTDHDSDPLRALLGAGLALQDGEAITVSVLARPATGRRVRRAKHQLRRLRTGTGSPTRAGRLFDLLTHQPSRTTPTAKDPEQNVELRAALTKAAGPQWETAIRYAVSIPIQRAPADPGGEKEAAREAVETARARARGRAHAVASSFAVHSGRNFYTRHRLRDPAVRLAERHFPRRGDLLSVPELASVAHLPLDAAAPGVQRAGARSVLPTAAIPTPGPAVKPLGTADIGATRSVGLSVADGRHHLHIVGATGSGKSTLMANMILADADAGRGALVIDPKGDLVNDLLARLPESALGRTVLIDPDDHALPPRLNVLEGPDADVVVDNLVGIFRRIFTAFWGPRTDDVMRAACLTLMTSTTTRGAVTLADIPRLLTEPSYRRRTTAGVNDRVLRGFWNWYEQLSEPSRAAATGPLMNKLRAFLLRPFVQNTIAAGPSTFDLNTVLDGGIALIRLPKGVLGEETARLLGSFVVAKTWQAAARRAGTREHTRRDAAMYLDEAQNFLTLPYPLEDMLAEARGYRLSLVLAHQHLAQLPHDLCEGISANARSKIVFNASPEDARELERHMAPNLTAHDLSHLGAYQAAARLIAASANTPAFTLRTTPLPARIPGRATAIRESSRTTYGPTPPVRK